MPNARAIGVPGWSTAAGRGRRQRCSSGQSAAIAETVLQSWPDRIDVFPCAVKGRAQRFAGLRGAGGFVVSGEWDGQRPKRVIIKAMGA